MPCGKVGSGAWRSRVTSIVRARRSEAREHRVEGRARGAVPGIGDQPEPLSRKPAGETRHAVGVISARVALLESPGYGRPYPVLPLGRLADARELGAGVDGPRAGPTSFIPFHSIGLCEAVTMSPPSAQMPGREIDLLGAAEADVGHPGAGLAEAADRGGLEMRARFARVVPHDDMAGTRTWPKPAPIRSAMPSSSVSPRRPRMS
jgi:hypothetical protein